MLLSTTATAWTVTCHTGCRRQGARVQDAGVQDADVSTASQPACLMPCRPEQACCRNAVESACLLTSTLVLEWPSLSCQLSTAILPAMATLTPGARASITVSRSSASSHRAHGILHAQKTNSPCTQMSVQSGGLCCQRSWHKMRTTPCSFQRYQGAQHPRVHGLAALQGLVSLLGALKTVLSDKPA